jgi:hypothetical protein
MLYKKNIFSFFLFLVPFFAQAQVNVIVGYDLGIKKQQEVNSAIARYNAAHNFSKNMHEIWTMTGLNLGLSYRLSNLTFEGHYITRFKTVGAKETTTTDVLKSYAKINDQGYSVGAMATFAKVGIGAAWEQHSYRFSRKFSGDKRFIEAFDTKIRYNTLNLFLDFYVRMNKQLGFHARPYYQLPLGGDNINQAAVDNALLLAPQNSGNSNTQWGTWGMKFLFFNGFQNNK